MSNDHQKKLETNLPTSADDQPAMPEERLDLTELQESMEDVRSELHKILVGQSEVLDLLLAALLAGGHVLVEGVPGVAKTLVVRLLARVARVKFKRIQFTPDLLPADIGGTSIFHPEETAFTFRRGPIFSNLVLIDEINRAPAKTQAALFEVMEERQVSADGETHPMAEPFLVVATQNPLEHEGTYRLPEAQLDRFLFKINVDYPELDEEVSILEGHHAGKTPDHLELIDPVLNADELSRYQEQVRQVHVERDLMRYVAQVADRSRNHEALALGASPRASLAVMRGAQALAALDGRAYVTPSDVQRAARPALRHRLMLTPEQEMEGRSADDAVADLVRDVEVPR
jgi:MoxR-like ATPase